MKPRYRIGVHAVAAAASHHLVATSKPIAPRLSWAILRGRSQTSSGHARRLSYPLVQARTLASDTAGSVPGKVRGSNSEVLVSKDHTGPHKSSSSGVILTTLLVGITALVYFSLNTGHQTQAPPEPDFGGISYATDSMAEIPPGRPGNLTPEQDELLRKLWSRLFEVCGVLQPEQPAAEAPPAADADADKGKKKSRMGIFSRRKTDASTTSTSSVVQEGDPDDKYGQNKIFLETLANMPAEEIRATIWSMVKFDNPDALVLRFLRARKWDVEKALAMLVSSMYWRCKEVKVDDDIMRRGEEGMSKDEKEAPEGSQEQKVGKGFMAQLRMGKSLVHGEDKMGRPVVIVRVRLHKAADQVPESIERYTIYLIETARSLIKPPNDTATLIFDMTEFSMANMDYSPVKFMIKCFEANYPESLGVVLVHKSPWLFQGIWRIIRGWLDPVVASKVNFTNDMNTMQEYMAVEKVPTELDGTEPWEYKYTEPIPGENDRMKDTATRDRLLAEREGMYSAFEAATLKMLRNPEDQALRKERLDMAAKLRTQYWQLDPYIRARSWYDRIGVLADDGKVDYYPPKDFKLTVNGALQEGPIETKQIDAAQEKASIQEDATAAVPVNSTA